MTIAAHRSSLGVAVSLSVHAAVIVALLLQPSQRRSHAAVMDLVIERAPRAEPKVLPKPPKAEVPLLPNAEPSPAPKAHRRSAKQAAPPEAIAPAPVPALAPTFDLGANTFAMEGGSWGLSPSEGDSTLGAFGAARAVPVPQKTQPAPASGGGGFKPIPTNDLKRRPKPERDIATPPYPSEAKRSGIEGAVVLRVEITKDGRVRSVRVVQDPGGGLGEAAHAAMLRERWSPALDRNGAPVDTVITYSYRFVLEG